MFKLGLKLLPLLVCVSSCAGPNTPPPPQKKWDEIAKMEYDKRPVCNPYYNGSGFWSITKSIRQGNADACNGYYDYLEKMDKYKRSEQENTSKQTLVVHKGLS